MNPTSTPQSDPTDSAPASKGPLDELLALHRSGTLAGQYGSVRGLVAELDGAELLTAGRVLAALDPAEVTRLLPGTPSVSVAVTGHGTLSLLVPALTAQLARHGLLARTSLSTFDNYVFDLLQPGEGLRAGDADLALCVLDPMIVFDEVPLPWRPEDVEEVLDAKLSLLETLASRFEAGAKGTLVLNTLPLPRRFTAQLVDQRSRARLGAAWREANARLLRFGERHPRVVVIDLDPLIAEGVRAFEARTAVYAKVYLSAELLASYAGQVAHVATNLTGRSKKLLAVDLDGTLWGGILGDDGIEGIEVADGLRGEAFRGFQRVVKQLQSQGVLLAAVSKNNDEPVRQVLREHPGMTLREDDFVRVTANWGPKHENLAQLAGALNLGVDSFVFADDSAYECGLVRRELPGVAVVHLDGDPAEHVGRLLADGWFDVPELTAEDRDRAVKYRDELARGDFLADFDSIEDYLRELGVTVHLTAVGEADLARVSQLTLRTNQFNLTTRRMQPAEVRALAEDDGGLVLAIRSADRFGDNGLVGTILARRERDELHIDNFVLSCRVFSRGIEQAALSSVLRHARETGSAAVVGSYRPTAKNGIVEDLYPKFGFTPADPADSGATFRHDLADIIAPPQHIDLITDFGEQSA